MRRSYQVFWAIVPVGTRDRYAAGYGDNSFDSEAEAVATIPTLAAAFNEANGDEWAVIAVCDGCGGDPERVTGAGADHRACVERAAEWGAEDGAEDTDWIDEGDGTGPEGPIAYTAETLRRDIDATRSWDEGAINAGALELAHREARGCAEDVREAYYDAYARAMEAAARERLAELVEAEAEEAVS